MQHSPSHPVTDTCHNMSPTGYVITLNYNNQFYINTMAISICVWTYTPSLQLLTIVYLPFNPINNSDTVASCSRSGGCRFQSCLRHLHSLHQTLKPLLTPPYKLKFLLQVGKCPVTCRKWVRTGYDTQEDC